MSTPNDDDIFTMDDEDFNPDEDETTEDYDMREVWILDHYDGLGAVQAPRHPPNSKRLRRAHNANHRTVSYRTCRRAAAVLLVSVCRRHGDHGGGRALMRAQRAYRRVRRAHTPTIEC